MATTLATSDSPEKSSSSNKGVYFDVRSDGPALRLTALSGGKAYGGWGSAGGDDAGVRVYACEGSSAGQETERGAWRQVGAGRLKKESTRLALSSLVVVGAGATVGLCVHATNGWLMRLSKPGKLGQVDASDGVVTLFRGAWSSKRHAFAGVDNDGTGYAVAGAVEYELGAAAVTPEPEEVALPDEEEHRVRRLEAAEAARREAAQEAAAERAWQAELLAQAEREELAREVRAQEEQWRQAAREREAARLEAERLEAEEEEAGRRLAEEMEERPPRSSFWLWSRLRQLLGR